MVSRYQQIADEIGVKTHLVPIEITESAAIDNDNIKGLADKFHDNGFPLLVDDFGSGYSSLATLNMKCFDTLKIDKSLIDYIGDFSGERDVYKRQYIGLYDTWSSYKPEDKGVLVAYASIHGNTAKAARKFAEMLRAKGVEKVSVMDLSRDDMAEVVEDAFRYDRMVLAAASYDGGVFPCMQDFLHHLQSKAFQNRTVGIIENGTWGPTAGRTMKGILETMKNITIVEPMVTIRSAMKESDLPAMEALADVIANA